MSTGYGVCIYRKNDDGSLDATWHASELPRDVLSNGQAVRKDVDTGNEFSGNYVVTYRDPGGAVEGVRDLKIRQENEIYQLEWLLDGEIVCKGVGFENDEALVVSYVDV